MHFSAARLTSLLAAFNAFSSVSAAPIEDRAVIDHDAVVPFLETIPNDRMGITLKKFQPFVAISSGCQPYPAVDKDGNTSGGLQDTGNISAGCRDQSKGQMYARGAWYKGRYAIMYSIFMPKDQPRAGNVVGGHRFDFEFIVVWLNNPFVENPEFLGAAVSAHGGVKKNSNPARSGSRVMVEYFAKFPTNHELKFVDYVGRDLTLVWWESMPPESRWALENTDFGKAVCPFKDAGNKFMSNLEKAYI
ncbi:hypothetical protein DSL72_008271 [Monilinia vaccinii-corymbosi]|uniref:Necrosis-and ethylene-inducing protein 1 n=1 Tax=Monilinia vaccinii-corymbosi TaxID=61207 RepID=A0A8A3PKC4_9HELO|nr:hypothetical protein DSL72_008271 [Monilinia vaccinii-corymbosi]